MDLAINSQEMRPNEIETIFHHLHSNWKKEKVGKQKNNFARVAWNEIHQTTAEKEAGKNRMKQHRKKGETPKVEGKRIKW